MQNVRFIRMEINVLEKFATMTLAKNNSPTSCSRKTKQNFLHLCFLHDLRPARHNKQSRWRCVKWLIQVTRYIRSCCCHCKVGGSGTVEKRPRDGKQKRKKLQKAKETTRGRSSMGPLIFVRAIWNPPSVVKPSWWRTMWTVHGFRHMQSHERLWWKPQLN